MKAYGGMNGEIHIFLTSALSRVEWSASRPGLFTPGENPRFPLERRFRLDDLKRKFLILPRLELRHFCHLARNQSLYRLSYPGSLLTIKKIITNINLVFSRTNIMTITINLICNSQWSANHRITTTAMGKCE
jgi:hypothetical protein